MVSGNEMPQSGRLLVAPLQALPEWAARLPADAHVVGLLGPGMEHPPLPVPEKRRLKMSFHDIAYGAATVQEGLQPPQTSHVWRLLAFARAWARSSSSLLLLHCWMGVSRSPAAAFIVHCALRPQEEELAIAEELRRLAPFATPNARLVALADEVLGRQGRMLEAIHHIGRGAETAMGTPFFWPLDGAGQGA